MQICRHEALSHGSDKVNWHGSWMAGGSMIDVN